MTLDGCKTEGRAESWRAIRQSFDIQNCTAGSERPMAGGLAAGHEGIVKQLGSSFGSSLLFYTDDLERRDPMPDNKALNP